MKFQHLIISPSNYFAVIYIRILVTFQQNLDHFLWYLAAAYENTLVSDDPQHHLWFLKPESNKHTSVTSRQLLLYRRNKYIYIDSIDRFLITGGKPF